MIRPKRHRGWWLGPVLAASSGALLYLAFPPAAHTGLAWVALAPLVAAALRSRPLGAFALGMIAGIIWFGGILDWIRLFGEPPFNTVLWLLAVTFEALFIGLFAFFARLLLAPRTGCAFVLGVPALWTAVEWLRCTGPWGFPWGVLGETQVHHSALIQAADTTGVWGITFLVALINGCIVGLLSAPSTAPLAASKRRATTDGPPSSPVPQTMLPADSTEAERTRGCSPPDPPIMGGTGDHPSEFPPLLGGQGGRIDGLLESASSMASRTGTRGERSIPPARRTDTAALLTTAIASAIALGYGHVAGNRRQPAGPPPLRVAVIQANLERDEQWQQPAEPLGAYGRLTRQLLTDAAEPEGHPNLVIWPETVIPGDLRRDPELREAVAALARQGPWHLLVGTPHRDDRNRPKNAAALFGLQGGLIGWYEKVHLVPFGEYIPMRGWLPFLDRFPGVTDQYPGEEYRPLVLQAPVPGNAGPIRVGAMICFESAFPDISRAFVRRGAGILAVLTSDASFGRSAAAEHHAAKAVFRAIETRRWVVQAATTGISLAVDPDGRVHRRVEIFEAGRFIVDAAPSRAVTSYVRYGDWLVMLCGLGILALAATQFMERRREGKDR